ncbi:MAG: hypothetical protein GY796_00095 [Chloroflexi bacterium]|nr:hypothetical protein [Chloroflexota bacterium]
MSTYANHHTSLIPIYHWRGARPALIDLEPDQAGWLVSLCLQRDGDVCLLPLAWDTNMPTDKPDPDDIAPIPTFHTQALDNTAVHLTLADLKQCGWKVSGRLTLHFSGADSEPNFEQTTQSYLWHNPGDHDGA